jgi:hypothetical protein
MGIDRKAIGLEMNEIPIIGIEELLKKETELAEEKKIAEKAEPKKEAESTKQ